MTKAERSVSKQGHRAESCEMEIDLINKFYKDIRLIKDSIFFIVAQNKPSSAMKHRTFSNSLIIH